MWRRPTLKAYKAKQSSPDGTIQAGIKQKKAEDQRTQDRLKAELVFNEPGHLRGYDLVLSHVRVSCTAGIETALENMVRDLTAFAGKALSLGLGCDCRQIGRASCRERV